MLAMSPAPRGLRDFRSNLPQTLAGVAVMFGLAALLWFNESLLFSFWRETFHFVGSVFGFNVHAVFSHIESFLVQVSLDDNGLPAMQLSCTLALVFGVLAYLGSYLLSKESVPGRYALRTLGVLAGAPAVGYLLLQYAPALNMQAHVAQVFKLGYWFMLQMPILYALTAFVLPGSLVRKVGWVLLAMAYAAVTTPVLALFHWQVLQLLGAAWLPLLNVLFTVLLMSMHLICFYGLLASED